MLRPLSAVAAGFIAWTIVFLGVAAGIRAAFPDDHTETGAVFAVVPLLAYLALDIVASFGAGAVAARIAPATGWAVPTTAGLLLAVGLAVQAMSWDLAPAWYNIAFLAILVPLTLIGGRVFAAG